MEGARKYNFSCTSPLALVFEKHPPLTWIFPDGLLDHDGDTERHEGLGEEDHLLSAEAD